MKRIITYLFTYDSGDKGKNVGFIKTDLRGTECLMEAHVNGYQGYQGKVGWYLLVPKADGQQLAGIPLGEFVLSHGRGSARKKFVIRPIEGTIYDFSQVVGVGIRCGSLGYLASCWKEEYCREVGRGEFALWDGKKEGEGSEGTEPESTEPEGMEPEGTDPESPEPEGMEPEGTEPGSPEPEGMEPEGTEPENTEPKSTGPESTEPESPEPENMKPESSGMEPMEAESAGKQDAEFDNIMPGNIENGEIKHNFTALKRDERNEIEAESTKQKPIESDFMQLADAEMKRIDLSDIKKLPSRNWYLCSNSFLLHGFFNYHYLIIKKVIREGKEKYYLGVPGIYEKPERVMATLFGFPNFENVEEKTGFGYWLCLLDM